MSQRKSLRKVLKDWRETLNVASGLDPFWRTQLGKGIRWLTSSDPCSKANQDVSATWYAGEYTDNER